MKRTNPETEQYVLTQILLGYPYTDISQNTSVAVKKLGVPARDAQLILGHSQVSITQEIYQHVDMDSRRSALERMETAFSSSNQEDGLSRQLLPSNFWLTGVMGWMRFGGALIKKFKPQLDEFKRWRVVLEEPYKQHINR